MSSVPSGKRIVAVDDSNMVLKTPKNMPDRDEYDLHANLLTAGSGPIPYIKQC